MARTFNRAYDQADRILNGSGLSPIVYRRSGSIIGELGSKVGKYGLSSIIKNLIPSTGKMFAAEPKMSQFLSSEEGQKFLADQFGIPQSIMKTVVDVLPDVLGIDKKDFREGTFKGITDKNVGNFLSPAELKEAAIVSELSNRMHDLPSTALGPPSTLPTSGSAPYPYQGKKGIVDMNIRGFPGFNERGEQAKLNLDLVNKAKTLGFPQSQVGPLAHLASLRYHGDPRFNIRHTLGSWTLGSKDPKTGGQRITDRYNVNLYGGKDPQSGEEVIKGQKGFDKPVTPRGIQEMLEMILGRLGGKAKSHLFGSDVKGLAARGYPIDITLPSLTKEDHAEISRRFMLGRLGGERDPLVPPGMKRTQSIPKNILNMAGQLGLGDESPHQQRQDHSLSGLEGYSEVTDPSSGVTTASIDDMAIDTTAAFKHGGQTMPRGLSGINKSININGQPHSLAWINPGEASALKAMGGSGKKVGGVPAYFIDYFGGEDSTWSPDDFGAADSPPIIDSVPAYRDSSSEPTPAPAAPDSYWGYEPEPDFGRTGPGFLGSDATEDDAKSLWMTQYIQSGRPRHDPVTQKEISIEEEWQKAKNAPGGLEAIARGYQIGNPLGEQMRHAFSSMNKRIQANMNQYRDEVEGISGEGELSRGAMQNAARKAGVENFTPYDGTPPAWMPTWMQAIVGFTSRTVIGTGTVGGVGVHVHEDGTVTAVSPEDSPGYDHAAQHEPGSDVPFRYRSKPVRQASVSETVEEKPTGMAALLARRSTPASGQEALQPQIDNLVASGIPLEEVFKMLNINV